MSDEAPAPVDGEGHPVGGPSPPAGEEELKWPFGFMAVLVLAALYLVWRLIQLLGGLFDLIG